MKRARQRRFKNRLLNLQGRLREEVEQLIESIPGDARSGGEHERAMIPSHEIDLEIAVENTEEGLHRQVAAALERIDRGTYGACEQCGGDIDEERLEALPFASRCVQCAR